MLPAASGTSASARVWPCSTTVTVFLAMRLALSACVCLHVCEVSG